MVISDIIAEFGAVYRAGGQGVKDLQAKITQKSVTDKLFDLRITENTKLEKATASITRVLQRFQKAFTPIGPVTFEMETIQLTKLKIDVSEYPDDLEESWLGFLADSALPRSTWPFVKYWLQELVLPQSEQNWENDEVFKGVLGAITQGTATGIGTQVNGIRKLIRDAYTAGKTNLVTLGAVPTDPKLFVKYMEAFYYAIPEMFRPFLNSFAMNTTLRDRFKDGMRSLYNTNYKQVDDLVTIIDTNTSVTGCPSHAGSNMIWITLKGNATLGIKKPANQQVFKVEEIKREVSAMTDFYKGLGFWYYGYLWHNEQDLS